MTTITNDGFFTTVTGVVPVSLINRWYTLWAAGLPATVDNSGATIQNPETQINQTNHPIFQKNNFGTNIMIRLGYDDALTVTANPVIKVYGRTTTQTWQTLKNKSSSLTTTLITAPTTDDWDATLFYTVPDETSSAWDCTGCNEILVGLQTALAGTGVTNNSILQIKVY